MGIAITTCNVGDDPVMYPESIAAKDRYPRIAKMWADTHEQPLDELKRYDWIDFVEWDNISTIEKLKTANPDQKHFMDYSIKETPYSERENNLSQLLTSAFRHLKQGFH